MARTLNGNPTGQAAQIDRRDKLEESLKYFRGEFDLRWFTALNRLKDLDPAGWEAWYDRQPEQSCEEMLPKIEELVKLLEVGK